MTIKVLGQGCKGCNKLTENVKIALEQLGQEAEVIKVTDIVEIMNFNAMLLPGLVIDEKLVSSGKTLKVDELIPLLSTEAK